jgi:hypothetical protein
MLALILLLAATPEPESSELHLTVTQGRGTVLVELDMPVDGTGSSEAISLPLTYRGEAFLLEPQAVKGEVQVSAHRYIYPGPTIDIYEVRAPDGASISKEQWSSRFGGRSGITVKAQLQ